MINDDKAGRFQLGVKFSCQADGAALCRPSCHEATVNVDALPDDLPVPDGSTAAVLGVRVCERLDLPELGGATLPLDLRLTATGCPAG